MIFGEMFNATSLHQEAVGYGGYKMLGNKHIEVHIYADVCRIFARNDDPATLTFDLSCVHERPRRDVRRPK